MGIEKVDAFKNAAEQRKFWEEITEVLERYPDLINRMRRTYENDPTNPHWDDEDRPYDPNEPSFIFGLMVAVVVKNTSGWEDMSVLFPYDQSHYVDMGMIHDIVGLFQ